jgi:hypothetical protein
MTWASAFGVSARPANATVAAVNSEMAFMVVSTPWIRQQPYCRFVSVS